MTRTCLMIALSCAPPLGAAGGAETPSTKPALNPQIAALGDGEAVRLKTNEPVPLGRGYCARMPYDPVNKVGIIYGSCHNPKSIAQNDVWTFDAATATWTELVKSDPRTQAMRYNAIGVRVPKVGPERPAGVGHTYNVICFDTALGKMVSLRGPSAPAWDHPWLKKAEAEKRKAEAKASGVDLDKAQRGMPWLLDVKSRRWTLAVPDRTGDTPYYSRAEACCYDPKHKRVLYWKTDPDVPNRRGGVYAWDGAANRWTFAPTKGGPAPGIEQLACWDTGNERVLYFSGSYAGTARQAKAFDYGTLTWTDLKAKNWPKAETPHPKRGNLRQFSSGGCSLAFDTLNGKAILIRAADDQFVVYPYDVRTNTFEEPRTFTGYVGGHLKSYYDPDQNAVIINGGRDLGKSQTWAYRYKRTTVTERGPQGSKP